MKEAVRKLVYDKYIRPLDNNHQVYVGVELEFPIVHVKGEKTDHRVCKEVFKKAVETFHLNPLQWDSYKDCIMAEQEENGDSFSFDCSYQTLEISFGKEKNLCEVQKRFQIYIRFFIHELNQQDHTITGMGIHPFSKNCEKTYISSPRYQMLEGYLHSTDPGKKPWGLHAYPEFGTFATSSQVQLDVKKEDLFRTIRAFTLLEPLKSLLFANSVLWEEEPDYNLVRDLLWERSAHGINPRNVGFYQKIPETEEEMIDYLLYTSLFCTERDGTYVFFYPIPVADYFKKDQVEGTSYDHGTCHKVIFSPDVLDLKYLRTYKHQDLTARGTLEHRSLCTQPLREALSGVAFQLGLSEKVDELEDYLRESPVLYGHGFSPEELRKSFNRGVIPDFISKDSLRQLLIHLVSLAEEGLLKRGYGEERLLTPVFDRAERIASPAQDMKEKLQNGTSMLEMVEEYSRMEI